MVSRPAEKRGEPKEIARAYDHGGELPSTTRKSIGRVARKDVDGDAADDFAKAEKKSEVYSLERARGTSTTPPGGREEGGQGGPGIATDAWQDKPARPKAGSGLIGAPSVEGESHGEKAKIDDGKSTVASGKPYAVETEVEQALAKRSAGWAHVRSAPEGPEAVGVAAVTLPPPDEPKALPSAEENGRKGAAGDERERARDFSSLDMPSKKANAELEEGRRLVEQLDTSDKERALYDTGLKAPKPPDDRKEEGATTDETALRHVFLKGASQDSEGLATQGQKATDSYLAIRNGLLDVRGNFVGAYKEIGGATTVFVLPVKDREKSLAEIKKGVAELGGTIEPLLQQGAASSRGGDAPEQNVLIVRLKASAFPSFREKYLSRSWSRGLSTHASGLEKAAESAKPPAQQPDTLTLLIRLVEVTDQRQTQQPPAK